MSFSIAGLDKLQKQIEKAARRNKARHRKLLADVGEMFLQKCAERAPKDTGELAASFSDSQRILDVDSDFVVAGTTYYVARMVEEGHEIVRRHRSAGRGKRGKYNKKKFGFAPGKHYMAAALDDAGKEIPAMAEAYLKEVGKEAGLDA
ncbi:MAG: HK97 gp10 family phage protein [Clostridiales bacterium]|nr:HK97 gp10 family phage protein [Clostridiales bacterium]